MCLTRFFVTIFALGCLVAGTTAKADEKIRPRVFAQFHGQSTKLQKHVHVPGAKVAYANYHRLKIDFPALATLTDTEIDRWIIDNFAYVSELQLRLRGIRTDAFEVDANKTKSYLHPQGYNRAAVAGATYQGQALGLIDLKGTGRSDQTGSKLAVPEQEELFAQAQAMTDPLEREEALSKLRTKDHSDGLATGGEAIAEVTRQQAVQAAFDLHNAQYGTSFQTVESYFIIHLPIKILRDGKFDYAAIYARQPHWRGISRLKVPENTYFDDFGGFQSSRFDSSVDFGGVVIALRELFGTFGDPASLKTNLLRNAQKLNAWVYGHRTATYFAENAQENYAQARAAVDIHIADMIRPLREKLDQLPKKSPREEYLAYITHRLGVRDVVAKETIAKEFLKLELPEIEARLHLVFAQSAADKLVAPIVDGLLAREEFAPGTRRHGDLVHRIQAYINAHAADIGNEKLADILEREKAFVSGNGSQLCPALFVRKIPKYRNMN